MTRRTPERRRAPRVEERLPLTIVAPAQELTASMRNLSSSGVYCELDHAVPLMTKVAVMVQLPARQIHCRGVVVRSTAVPREGAGAARHMIAIFFTHLHVRDRQAIARFVAERLAPSSPPQTSAHRGAPLNCFIVALAVLSALAGCAAPLTAARGPRITAMVDALGTTAEDGKTYTFRWLQRRFVDFYWQLRSDGLIVDLQGREIHVLRRHDGDHIVLLDPQHAAANKLRPQQLTIAAKDLPTLQAVVRRYRFEPCLITDANGAPQAVIYAPIPTRITVTSLDHGTIRVEIQRTTGQPDAATRDVSIGGLSGSAF